MDDWDDFDDPAADFDDWDGDDDVHDAGLYSSGWDEEDDEDALDAADGDGVWRAGAEPRSHRAGMVSAWQFGTATAVAGWLLDQQADRIAAAVREVAAAPAAGSTSAPRPAPGERVGSRHGPTTARRWAALAGEPIDWNAAPLRPGDVLERSRLAVTLAVHMGAGRALGLDARPTASTGSPPGSPELDWAQLSFSIAAVDLVPELPLWVMADLRPRGFDAGRLQTIFADPGPPGRAYCFVDTPQDAVKVLEWGLARHGLLLRDFRWQPA